MGFFLLRRDQDEVALISPTVFATRSEAVAHVDRLMSEGLLRAEEIFVADLELAAPVLVVTAPATAPAQTIEVEEPIAEAILADAGLQEGEDAAEPEAADELAEPEAADEPAEPEPAHEAAAEPDVADVEDAPAPPEDESIPVPLEIPDAAPDEDAGSESATQEWPWDVPAVSVDEDPDDVGDAIAEEQVPAEVSDIAAELDEIVPDAEAVAPEIEVSEEVVEQPVEEPELEEPPKAYEPGSSDITALTCDDCVYLNTCPKKEESDPSSCGSFQWRSV